MCRMIRSAHVRAATTRPRRKHCRTETLGQPPPRTRLACRRMTNGSFGFGLWATVTPPSTWQFLAGSFSGQVAGELFGYERTTGTLWVGCNTGTSFNFAKWARVDPGDGWKSMVAVL